MQLVSHPICPYVHRAAAFLKEKGVAFDWRPVDLQRKPDWFLALSPRGKVPVLVTDDGTAIFESVVILEYLDETNGMSLLPADPLERARHRMWIEISNDLMTGHYKVATAATPADRAAARRALRDTLERFEQVVRGPWFDGDTLSLVDFAAGPALVRIERIDRWLDLSLFDGLPKVAAWARAVVERPAFRDTMVADFDDRLRAVVVDHHVAA
jgi:glutathione S-transferase